MKAALARSSLGDRERSGILTFCKEGIYPQKAVDLLKTEQIYLSARHGSLRASPHYYNSQDKIAAVVERLSRLARQP